MKAEIILGVNIDTKMWIDKLKKQSSQCIIVVDYDSEEEVTMKDGVIYISNFDKDTLSFFDEFVFYKSLYIYPGMSGKRSLL